MLEVDCQEVQICFWNPGVRKGGSMRATMERMGNRVLYQRPLKGELKLAVCEERKETKESSRTQWFEPVAKRALVPRLEIATLRRETSLGG